MKARSFRSMAQVGRWTREQLGGAVVSDDLSTGGAIVIDFDHPDFLALYPPRKKAAPRKRGPGDVVKAVLAKLNLRAGSDCGCEEMRRQMNEWGCWGCWRRRKIILAWFAKRARERGIVVEEKNLFGLLAAAWRESKKACEKAAD